MAYFCLTGEIALAKHYTLSNPTKKSVWLLLVLATISWGICYAYVSSPIHFGWLGTLLASAAGILATISAYQTEEKAHTRGGGVYKSRSPLQFLLVHLLLGLVLTTIALFSVIGCLEYASGS
ncbi:putative outer membrane lipoprotein [Paraburkholderia phenoliruptrix]|nr:putative outer membrane lipoprotein [Paraburkholderia phenoliruptrix]